MRFFDFTKYKAVHTIISDKDALEVLLVVSRATFKIGENGSMDLAEEQVEPLMSDEYYGEPGVSSLKLESDLALQKTGLDLVMIGHAWNKNPKAGFVDVSMSFNKWRKCVRVFGNRYWKKGMLGYFISKPEPFQKIPLKYELAYGGADYLKADDSPVSNQFNPVGKGFAVKKSKTKLAGRMLPNLENPDNLIKKKSSKPAPSGFGFVCRSWSPRKEFAGTYDESWQKKRMPLLPDDFDNRFYDAASRGMSFKNYRLKGGEKVEIVNGSESGFLSLQLPAVSLETVISINQEYTVKKIAFDTVIIDTDEMTVSLVGRNYFNVQNQIYDIDFVKIQNISEEHDYKK